MNKSVQLLSRFASALLLAACASPAYEADPGHVPSEAATTSQALKMRDGLGLRVVHDGLLEDGGSLELELLNTRAVPAMVDLDVTLIGGEGIEPFLEIERAQLEAGQRSRVSIPARALSLPTSDEPAPARLFVTSRAYFDDGTVTGLSVPAVYYQRVRAGWALADDEEQLIAATGIPRAALNAARVFDTDLYGADPALDGDDGAAEAADPLQPATTDPLHPPHPIMERLEVESEPLLRSQDGALVDKAEVSVDFCLSQVTTYLDAGMGEDNWTSRNPTARLAIGQDIAFHRGLCSGGYCQWLFVDRARLGDGYIAGKNRGCTGPIDMSTGLIRITVFSTGTVNGTNLWVSPDETYDSADTFQFTHNLTSGGVKNLTFTPGQDDMLNVYMAAAQGLRVVGGINKIAETDYRYAYMRQTTSSSHKLTYNDNLFLLRQHYQDKHEITHAVGHYIQFRATGNAIAYDCSDTGGGGACATPSGQQRTWFSREWQSCALSEGYANFYGSIAWNDNEESDCVTTWGNDCAADGTTSWRHMEQDCRAPYSDGDTFRAHGSEIDWQRALWEVMTKGTGDPYHNDMLRWMRDADNNTAWTRDNSFLLLNSEANDIGGVINTRFDAAKGRFGVDH